jgi:hypothetical protein
MSRESVVIKTVRDWTFLLYLKIFYMHLVTVISPTPCKKLFDHKAVTLRFNDRTNGTGMVCRPSISNKDLDDDLLEFLIRSTVAETYLIHSNNDVNNQVLLDTCGTIKNLIRDCGPPLQYCIGEEADAEKIDNRIHNLTRLQVVSNTLDMNLIENLELRTAQDIFMETLLNNVRNETISHQTFMRKAKFKKLTWLRNGIKSLKKTLL